MNGQSRRTSRPGQEHGAALLIMLVIMVVGALYFVVGQSQTARVRVERDAITAAALAQAKEALIGYAITYSDTHPGEVFGYFPCPDTESLWIDRPSGCRVVALCDTGGPGAP